MRGQGFVGEKGNLVTIILLFTTIHKRVWATFCGYHNLWPA